MQNDLQNSLFEMIDSGLVGVTDISGWGVAREEDAQGTPTQSHISPSIRVYEDTHLALEHRGRMLDRKVGPELRLDLLVRSLRKVPPARSRAFPSATEQSIVGPLLTEYPLPYKGTSLIKNCNPGRSTQQFSAHF